MLTRDPQLSAEPTSPVQSPGLPRPPAPNSKLTLWIASLGIFLAALDQTVIVTALWPISSDLSIPIDELDKAAWVVTAYLLGYTVALPLMGRVADVYGQRRVYLIALGVFLLGSVACARAPDLPWLVAARAVQAVGGGALLPVGMAMARHLYSERRVPFILGILGAVAEAGGVIGPLWGALILNNMEGLLRTVGWRWIFWVNVPLGLLFIALMFLAPPLRGSSGKVDWAGAGLLGAALLALSLGLSTPGSVGAWAGLDTLEGGSGEFFTWQSFTLFGLSALLLVLFWLRQRRAEEPLLPPSLFSRHKWPFSAANLTNLFVGAALIITMVNVPLYVASVLDGTVEQGGLMLLRMTAFIPVGAILGGLLTSDFGFRIGGRGSGIRGRGLRGSGFGFRKSNPQSSISEPRPPTADPRFAFGWVAAAGLLLTAAGFWQMSTWTLTSADDLLTWVGLALNGLGFGLLISPVTATALGWAGLKRAALGAASVNLARMVGMLVSLSFLTVWGLRHFQQLMAPYSLGGTDLEKYEAAYKAASLEVYTRGFFAAALICLLALPFALSLRLDPQSDLIAVRKAQPSHDSG